MEELDSGNTRLIRTELNRICTETYVEMIAGRIVVVGQIFALIVARFVADVVAQPPAAVAAAAVVVAAVAPSFVGRVQTCSCATCGRICSSSPACWWPQVRCRPCRWPPRRG